jgi:hypothetical protein
LGENDKKQAAVWHPHSISRRGAETIQISLRTATFRGAVGRGSGRDADFHAVYNQGVLVSEFQYELPEELIAQEPLADRAGSRMLHVHSSGELSDRRFREFPELLRVGDLVVFNDTRECDRRSQSPPFDKLRAGFLAKDARNGAPGVCSWAD